MLPNHSVTFCLFLHWFTFKIYRSFVFILSNIDLLIFSGIAFCWVDEPAFRVVFKIFLMIFERNKSFAFFMLSIRLPIESLFATCFSSLFISEIFSSDPCLFVFVILSCKNFLYVSSEVSYIFLVLSGKTIIFSDELVLFKPKCLENSFCVSKLNGF